MALLACVLLVFTEKQTRAASASPVASALMSMCLCVQQMPLPLVGRQMHLRVCATQDCAWKVEYVLCAIRSSSARRVLSQHVLRAPLL